jgi:hypothetical protein
MESRDKSVNEQITNYSSRTFENSPYAESPADSHSLTFHHSLSIARGKHGRPITGPPPSEHLAHKVRIFGLQCPQQLPSVIFG